MLLYSISQEWDSSRPADFQFAPSTETSLLRLVCSLEPKPIVGNLLTSKITVSLSKQCLYRYLQDHPFLERPHSSSPPISLLLFGGFDNIKIVSVASPSSLKAAFIIQQSKLDILSVIDPNSLGDLADRTVHRKTFHFWTVWLKDCLDFLSHT